MKQVLVRMEFPANLDPSSIEDVWPGGLIEWLNLALSEGVRKSDVRVVGAQVLAEGR